ncbi:hypothetical protein [Celeribacter sp.]|uniref:hypothetical protein n=1 Tax=Celeribacter sp. TaxID=1890673 RepID=UPI003A9171D6
MSRTTLFVASLLVSAPAAAFAETTYLSFGASYNTFSAGSFSANVTRLDAAYEGQIDKLTYDVVVSSNRYKEGSSDHTFSSLDLLLGYDVSDALTILGGVSVSNPYDDDTVTLSIGAEYATGPWTYGGIVSSTRVDGDSSELGELYVDYNSGPFEAYASVLVNFDEERDTFYRAGVAYENDAFDTSLDAVMGDDYSIIEAAGKYNINTNFRLFGSVGAFLLEDENIYETRIGAGYMVSDNLWIDGFYNRMSGDLETGDGFGIMVSYEFGSRRLRAADRLTTYSEIANKFPFLGT